MEYNNISNDELSNMIDCILSGRPIDNVINSESEYTNEKAAEFIKSLKDMVK